MSIPGKVLSFCLVLAAAAMQPAIAVAQTSLDELARDVDRAESMHAVKNLQRSYAQYSQYGLWNEMADLFAREPLTPLMRKRSKAARRSSTTLHHIKAAQDPADVVGL